MQAAERRALMEAVRRVEKEEELDGAVFIAVLAVGRAVGRIAGS